MFRWLAHYMSSVPEPPRPVFLLLLCFWSPAGGAPLNPDPPAASLSCCREGSDCSDIPALFREGVHGCCEVTDGWSHPLARSPGNVLPGWKKFLFLLFVKSDFSQKRSVLCSSIFTNRLCFYWWILESGISPCCNVPILPHCSISHHNIPYITISYHTFTVLHHTLPYQEPDKILCSPLFFSPWILFSISNNWNSPQF